MTEETEQAAKTPVEKEAGKPVLPAIHYLIPKDKRGHDFNDAEALLAHLSGEASGLYLVGSQGMWHGGIHITNSTTPWCALSGSGADELKAVPHPYTGEQPLRCMADGDIVAYRIAQDYQVISWRGERLHLSTSFLLVRHYIQPGPTAKSGLHFHTLYMHMAPYAAYPDNSDQWQIAEPRGLSAYADAEQNFKVGVLPKGTPFIWNRADGAAQHTGGNQRQYGYVTLKADAKTDPVLYAGDKVWILVDKDNIAPTKGGVAVPEWWASLGKALTFDSVVTPSAPVSIKAGAAIGHLGFYQLPDDNGYRSRYQAHIECFSTDSQLLVFLTNPEGAGKEEPGFFSYPEGATLYLKHGGKIAASKLSTLTAGVQVLSASGVVKEQGKAAYYLLSGEQHLAAADVTLVSRFDLAGRGFVTIDDELPDSFDLVDGKKPPKNAVRGILTQLYDAAVKDPRHSQAMNRYNYQRLLAQIDANRDGFYPEEEYLQAVHAVSYRDALYRLIVKHPSEWYYGKDDVYWKNYLDTLTHDAPVWKTYIEAQLGPMNWMKGIPGMVGEIWHMHPVMFLDALREPKKRGWAHSPFADLLGRVESKNDYTAYNQIFHNPKRTVPKYHTRLTSMTIEQIMEAQEHTNVMFATGRFQIIPSTLKEAVRSLHLDVNERYDEVIQDRIFEEYLIKVKRKPILDYLEGDGSAEEAAYAWSMEFASAGVRKGRSISKGRIAETEGVSNYSGDGLNKAHIMPDEMVSKLEESKNGGQ